MINNNWNILTNTVKHSDINLFIVGIFFYDQVVALYSDFYATPDFKFIYLLLLLVSCMG